MGDMPVRVSRLYLITAVVGLISGVGGALVAQPAGRLIHPTAVRIGNTAADALDVSGGAQFGSGDVALIGTDGKINGPLSSTILDDLSGANLTSLNATNISTGTLASARGGVPANAVIFIPATTCPTGLHRIHDAARPLRRRSRRQRDLGGDRRDGAHEHGEPRRRAAHAHAERPQPRHHGPWP